MSIDQGVRLEVRLISSSSGPTTDWFPVRYYTPSLEEPDDYDSFVALDSSDKSVTAKGPGYDSSFPLIHVTSTNFVRIREYICGQLVQNFTDDGQVELRWMQRFGENSRDSDATWILDDINVTFWNGTCFLQVLHEDFSGDELTIANAYDVELAETEEPTCDVTNGKALVFRHRTTRSGMSGGRTGDRTGITTRSLSVVIHRNDISETCEERDYSKLSMLSLLFCSGWCFVVIVVVLLLV